MKIEKYNLNLAGEYRTCSELLKRNIFATITLGNMKSVDVVAVGANRRAAIIEVKTTQKTKFVTGFYQKFKTVGKEHPDFWILYSLKPAADSFTERFFVLSHEEMAEAQAKVNHAEELSYEERVRRVAKGVDGVRANDVQEHEDKWNKIVDWCSD